MAENLVGMLSRSFLCLILAGVACRSHSSSAVVVSLDSPDASRPAKPAGHDAPAPCVAVNAALTETWSDLAVRMDQAGNDCDQITLGLDHFVDDRGAALRRALDAAIRLECDLSAEDEASFTGIIYRAINRPNLACQAHVPYFDAAIRLVSVLGEVPPEPAPPATPEVSDPTL